LWLYSPRTVMGLASLKAFHLSRRSWTC
jgi:hypothetical protein